MSSSSNAYAPRADVREDSLRKGWAGMHPMAAHTPLAAGTLPERPERNLALRAAGALLVLVLLSCHFAAGTLAKYVVADSSAQSARVATFAFNLADGKDSHIVDIAAIEKPGDTARYTFTVQGRSEASVRYWLELSQNGSMPLEYTLTRHGARGVADGTVVLSTTVDAHLKPAAANDELPLVRATAAVPKAPNSEADAYTLEVRWPAAWNDLEFANDSVEELVLSALAEQVD